MTKVLFDEICALFDILQNIFSPESKNHPPLGFQPLIDFPIAFYIPLYLGDPIIAIRLYRILPVLPIITVPEFAVTENGQLLSDENYDQISRIGPYLVIQKAGE